MTRGMGRGARFYQLGTLSRIDSKVVIVAALVLTLGGWLLLLNPMLTIIRQYGLYSRLQRDGVVTTGTITSGPTTKNHPTEYDFVARRADGTSTTIHATEYTGDNLPWVRPGDTVYLRYDPTDPTISRLDGNPYSIWDGPGFLLPVYALLTLINLMFIAEVVMKAIRFLQERGTSR